MFRHMLAAIISKDWDTAAKEMLNSVWAKQTADRAYRHATVMQAGVWNGAYLLMLLLITDERRSPEAPLALLRMIQKNAIHTGQ